MAPGEPEPSERTSGSIAEMRLFTVSDRLDVRFCVLMIIAHKFLYISWLLIFQQPVVPV